MPGTPPAPGDKCGAIKVVASSTLLRNLNGTRCGMSVVSVTPTARTREARKPPPSPTMIATASSGTISRLNFANSARAFSSGGGEVGSTMPRKQQRSSCFAISDRTTKVISATEARVALKRQIARANLSQVRKQNPASRATTETLYTLSGGFCHSVGREERANRHAAAHRLSSGQHSGGCDLLFALGDA